MSFSITSALIDLESRKVTSMLSAARTVGFVMNIMLLSSRDFNFYIVQGGSVLTLMGLQDLLVGGI